MMSRRCGFHSCMFTCCMIRFILLLRKKRLKVLTTIAKLHSWLRIIPGFWITTLSQTLEMRSAAITHLRDWCGYNVGHFEVLHWWTICVFVTERPLNTSVHCSRHIMSVPFRDGPWALLRIVMYECNNSTFYTPNSRVHMEFVHLK